jgi:salicylate hydroxylase
MTRDSDLSQPLKIVIVGAGIGGIACAVECRKKGFDVVMYDQVKVRSQSRR